MTMAGIFRSATQPQPKWSAFALMRRETKDPFDSLRTGSDQRRNDPNPGAFQSVLTRRREGREGKNPVLLTSRLRAFA